MTSTEPTVEVNKNPCEREVSVEVPAEDVTREWKSAVARFQKHARIPGFRSGKVPATLVRSKFADEIKSEVVEHLVPAAFRAETKKQNLIPVGQPQVVELELEEDKPLRFKAIFEVLPPFEVNGYKEIKVAHEAVAVSDEEVEKTIDGLREQNSTYVNMDEDRGLADGDFASVAFKSTSQEEGAEPVEMKDVLVDIGGANTLPEFSENLRGAKAGETRSFDVTYAEDFGDKRLAGKTLHYEVEVKGIKTKVRAGAERRVGERAWAGRNGDDGSAARPGSREHGAGKEAPGRAPGQGRADAGADHEVSPSTCRRCWWRTPLTSGWSAACAR